MGESYQDEGMNKEAISSLVSAIEVDSTYYPVVYRKLGDLYLLEGLYSKSKKAYKDYFRLDSKSGAKDVLSRLRLAKAIFGENQIKHPVPYSPVAIKGEVNDTNSEFINAVSANDSLLFYTFRTLKNITVGGRRSAFTEYIKVAKRNPVNGEWKNTESLQKIFGKPAITGAMSISPNGREIYLTACGV